MQNDVLFRCTMTVLCSRFLNPGRTEKVQVAGKKAVPQRKALQPAGCLHHSVISGQGR